MASLGDRLLSAWHAGAWSTPVVVGSDSHPSCPTVADCEAVVDSGDDSRLWVTTDGGDHWAELAPLSSTVFEFSCDATRECMGLIPAMAAGSVEVLVTTLGQPTWSVVTVPLPTPTIVSSGPYCRAGTGCWMLVGSEEWLSTPSGTVGASAQIWQTSDGGVHWTVRAAPTGPLSDYLAVSACAAADWCVTSSDDRGTTVIRSLG